MEQSFKPILEMILILFFVTEKKKTASNLETVSVIFNF